VLPPLTLNLHPSPRQVVRFDQKYKRWIAMYDMEVAFTSRTDPADVRKVPYDVLGHPRSDFKYALTVPFHRGTADSPPAFTMVREYFQGPHLWGYTFPCGSYDAAAHGGSIARTAEAELSEEVGLRGRCEPLFPAGHPGMFETKWCLNRGIYFIAVDPEPDAAPRARDHEEFTIEIERVPLDRFRELRWSGLMAPHSVMAGTRALAWLQDKGMI
jgi:hypothetical protein